MQFCNNEIEISNLFGSIKDHFVDFKLIISLNSRPGDRISDERIQYIGNKKNVGFPNNCKSISIKKKFNLIVNQYLY